MKLFGHSLTLPGKRTGRTVVRMSRDDYIFWSTIILAFTFVSLSAYDVYMFYEDILNNTVRAPNVNPPSHFSASDIDEVITLLDARKDIYDSILNAIPKTPTATSTKP